MIQAFPIRRIRKRVGTVCGLCAAPTFGWTEILRVARTIADLEGAAEINAAHLSEAINYRMLDRQMWT